MVWLGALETGSLMQNECNYPVIFLEQIWLQLGQHETLVFTI